ncbi:sulfatase-like hydrolase/transferase [Aliiroseovarius crassostreae]|uniref:sulfatase-like hydrolase/transferase n=1 Tax=Aliiroseovarius crassostreae TaxID=154981 RepID=UPI0021AFCD41|nr:sulfatase-like hydrolase/transferase [Aliiroseovarius crassostreae]UWQ08169.1 sulfatase-like hydrolase/transferase [Aliiroseovarius crassostreae]
MAPAAPNILFIMYDQLRFDYLGCAGHKTLETPNFDRVAARGVRFDRAYCQSPVCGSSRMSTYTGRYVSSHGAAFNNFPLKVGELTMGDHLRSAGMGCWLIGKTHMKADAEGMARLGLAPDSVIGTRIGECGFDIWIRDDGLWAEGPDGFYDPKRSPYNAYLRDKGYTDHNPWHDHANAGIDDAGDIASGFLMMHAGKPANIREEDSETPWLTDRAIEFMQTRKGDGPWCAHLSYIKPHWPYIVPPPYHDLYGIEDIQPVVRADEERQQAHPVFDAYLQGQLSAAFSRDEVRDVVIPAYMGLIKQCDDHLGRILDFLDESGQAGNTVIVLTSDHGDYMGDHWMGEKDFFHDPSVRVPLIIADPRPQADATRGTVSDRLVEQIDLAPTFVDMAGGDVADHILEGRSLVPLLHGDDVAWREFAISEYDYSTSPMADRLGLSPRDCRLFMVVTDRWKLIHAEGGGEGGFRPMLFDLETDPEELTDLGTSKDHFEIITRMYDHLHHWARRMSQRTTVSDNQILARRKGGSEQVGVLIGVYGDEDLPDRYTAAYRGKATPVAPEDKDC